MLSAGTVIFVAATYALMLVAYFLARYRVFHMTVMSSIIVVDLAFPVYLVLTHDWMRRLIDQEEILSFLVWMHVILIITLYMLYAIQINAARGILSGREGARNEHKMQALGILIIRALVLLSGALLVEPESTVSLVI